MQETKRLGPRDALLLVDVQLDFCPGGALAVPEGDHVVAVLNRWIDRALEDRAFIVASRCWHPPNHVSFQVRGGPWPPHCVQGTEGAKLHPGLRLPQGTPILPKGQDPDRDAYSAFDDTGLADLLEQHGVRRIFIGGLAVDVCVRASVLDALQRGLTTHVLLDATRPVNAEGGVRVLREMQKAGAHLEHGA